MVKLPIFKDLLNTIICITGDVFHKAGQVYLAILYQTLFITAYYGLFRIGELTASPHAVKACDVHIADNKKKILFVLRSSKTHGKGSPPQLIKIMNSPQQMTQKNSTTSFCPYQLLRNYLKLRCGFLDHSENFLIFRDHSPICPYHVRLVLRNVLNSAGFDSSKYSTHAFHAGRAGDLLKLGVSVETIKKIGRWKSNAVYKYLKASY